MNVKMGKKGYGFVSLIVMLWVVLTVNIVYARDGG
jgi:hypothetical protein